MAESSLSLGYADFAAEVGEYLGYGPTSSNWTTDQASRISRIIKSGMRQFYNPPPLPGDSIAHKWSFLEPAATLTTVADDYDYDLPDDFGFMKGDVITYDADEGGTPIRIIGEAELRALRQDSDSSGKPLYVAVRPLYDSTLDTAGQRFEAIFWPAPDAAYTLHYTYSVSPQAIDTTTNVYPLGGMVHAETQLESCLAIAEERMDDESGLHARKFMQRLAASVAVDRRQGAVFLGYNGSGRDDAYWTEQQRLNTLTVKVNGTDMW